jgi:hypothetical protein
VEDQAVGRQIGNKQVDVLGRAIGCREQKALISQG